MPLIKHHPLLLRVHRCSATHRIPQFDAAHYTASADAALKKVYGFSNKTIKNQQQKNYITTTSREQIKLECKNNSCASG